MGKRETRAKEGKVKLGIQNESTLVLPCAANNVVVVALQNDNNDD